MNQHSWPETVLLHPERANHHTYCSATPQPGQIALLEWAGQDMPWCTPIQTSLHDAQRLAGYPEETTLLGMIPRKTTLEIHPVKAGNHRDTISLPDNIFPASRILLQSLGEIRAVLELPTEQMHGLLTATASSEHDGHEMIDRLARITTPAADLYNAEMIHKVGMIWNRPDPEINLRMKLQSLLGRWTALRSMKGAELQDFLEDEERRIGEELLRTYPRSEALGITEL